MTGQAPGDPLDLADVPALVVRLKAFLTFLRVSADGIEGKGRPSVKTMQGYVWQLQQMVNHKLEQTYVASRIEEEKCWVMQSTGDREGGVKKAIIHHAEYFCRQYSLPTQVFERPAYGWNKAALLLKAMQGHILGG